MGSSFSSRRQPLVQRDRDTAGSTNVALHQPCVISKTIPQIPNERTVELCNRCREIDLDDFFCNEAPGMTRKPKEVLYLGRLEKETTCELCQFFHSILSLQYDVVDPTKVTLCSWKFGWGYGISAAYSDPHYAPSRILFVIPGEPSDYVYNDGSIGYLHDAEPEPDRFWIVPQSHTAAPFFGHEKPSLSALPFSTTSINYPLLRAWCEHCDTNHSTCSSAREMRHRSNKQGVGPAVRCIDCHTREIVEIATFDRFLALSYVWGEQPHPASECTSGARETASIRGARQLPDVIPKVIEDAMIVVTNLGERYLWVDQYCIDQNDADDKHAQIGNMAAIYEGAYATIVAFSATDSASGLPGVRNLARKPYPSVAHPKHPLSVLRPSVISYAQLVKSSVWMTRGWTFQEAVLSRRLLIFTDYQVEFICSNAVWHECTPPGTGDGPSTVSKKARSDDHLTMNYLKAITPMERSAGKIPLRRHVLVRYIEEYSGRQLTYQSDNLNAITGLLSRISTLTYMGIPILDRAELAARLPRSLVVANALRQFLVGLAWYPARSGKIPLQRRYAFPSWSWLGWEGQITLPFLMPPDDKDDPFAGPRPRALSSIWIAKQVTLFKGSRLVPFAHLLENPRLAKEAASILPHSTNHLWVEGQVIKMTFTTFEVEDSQQEEEIGEDVFIPKCIYPPVSVGYGSWSKSARVYFRNSRPDNVDPWTTTHTRIMTERWDCLLLLTMEFSYSCTCYFLILDQARRDGNTEAEDCHCVVGSAKLLFPGGRVERRRMGRTYDDHTWYDPSLRRRIKLC